MRSTNALTTAVGFLAAVCSVFSAGAKALTLCLFVCLFLSFFLKKIPTRRVAEGCLPVPGRQARVVSWFGV